MKAAIAPFNRSSSVDWRDFSPCSLVWVKIRASEAERTEWHVKARSVGLSLSDLVRRSVGRVRTWTVPHA